MRIIAGGREGCRLPMTQAEVRRLRLAFLTGSLIALCVLLWTEDDEA